MAKINSLAHLQDALDRDFAWRKKEISDLKIQCELAPQNIIMHKSAILLIYAHWEGFIKNAAKNYLEFLNNQKLLCKDMQENFLILHLGGVFQEELNYKNFSHRGKILTEFNNSLTCEFKVCTDKTINTNSNLKSENFKLILEQLGIPKHRFELKFQIIDEKLLQYRNAIAHGETRPNSDICSVVRDIKDVIVELLNEFHSQILTAAEEKRYLKIKTKE
ncbi:hypothetical protein BGI36_05660 [Snodgrassella communis]|uniref:MAE_28990/MAE_18760 family HEPN-like nuclease n=1 Tax=Snodgrassella communis TaxID=2946699 RepID=UPI000C1EFF00|nr:MAE_28990/MAE_18760 family HEPN-like nuclease [Snodgrassella communis]PIT21613.1 hypothetical protein BGI36_05660 [Snodgrassella communis]